MRPLCFHCLQAKLLINCDDHMAIYSSKKNLNYECETTFRIFLSLTYPSGISFLFSKSQTEGWLDDHSAFLYEWPSLLLKIIIEPVSFLFKNKSLGIFLNGELSVLIYSALIYISMDLTYSFYALGYNSVLLYLHYFVALIFLILAIGSSFSWLLCLFNIPSLWIFGLWLTS